MPILFIDTHSAKVTLALKIEDKIYKKERVSEKSHSEVVIPLLDELLREAGVDCSIVDEVIVVNGPGSFTGVRIGVTIAKAIAYSLNVPIKTITSLEVFKESSNEEGDIVAIEDAKGVYFAKKEKNTYSDYRYLKKSDFSEFLNKTGYKVSANEDIDLDKVIEYAKGLKPTDVHLVKPVYIKEIDVEK